MIKISMVTGEVENIPFQFEIDHFGLHGGTCAINDQFYITFNDSSIDKLAILAINLLTLERRLIQSPISPSSQYVDRLILVTKGTDIYYFHGSEPVIYVFDTVNELWREIKNADVTLGRKVIYQDLMVNGEFVAFKRADSPYYPTWSKWVEIFNFNTMKWRKGRFSDHPECDASFTHYFEFDKKIITIKNANKNSISSSSANLSDFSDLEVYVLNLNPSLEALCSAVVIQFNLNVSILPQKIQDELKRYLKAPE
ncbi:hypothetical protein CHUAL_007910 [Chamberlinius hualienensis]